MRNVNVRPRPGSGKVLSSCRDAFHAKGNRAELVFENCILEGLGDDAFNISTHCSCIVKVRSGSRIEVRQAFPLQFMPMCVGDEVVVMSPETNELIGSAVIEQIKWTDGEGIAKYENRFRGRAPLLRLVLEKEIPNLKKGMVIWGRQTANPKSLVKGCKIRRSCRFQTPVRLENCDVEAYMTFYGDKSEGPGPEWFEIVDSTIKSANVGDFLATSVGAGGFEGSSGKPEWEITPEKAQLKRVTITGNEIWGSLRIRKAFDVEIHGNRIVYERGEPISVEACGSVRESGNRHTRTPVDDLKKKQAP
jgi:hypothetical protein